MLRHVFFDNKTWQGTNRVMATLIFLSLHWRPVAYVLGRNIKISVYQYHSVQWMAFWEPQHVPKMFAKMCVLAENVGIWGFGEKNLRKSLSSAPWKEWKRKSPEYESHLNEMGGGGAGMRDYDKETLEKVEAPLTIIELKVSHLVWSSHFVQVPSSV